jgi:hypothetical protein
MVVAVRGPTIQRSRSTGNRSLRTCLPVPHFAIASRGHLAEEKDTTVVRQTNDTLEDIFCRLQRGELSRRAFVRRATGLGIGGAAAALLARAALAEDAIPIGEALANERARLPEAAPNAKRVEAPRRHNRLGRNVENSKGNLAQPGQPQPANRPDEP